MWMNKNEGLSVCTARPLKGKEFFLNVNVIQIYGREIDGCWGYGSRLDAVYVIEMHTDKKGLPLSSGGALKPKLLQAPCLEMNEILSRFSISFLLFPSLLFGSAWLLSAGRRKKKSKPHTS